MPTWPATIDPPLQGMFDISSEPNVTEFKPDVFSNMIRARRYTAKAYVHSGTILLKSAEEKADLEEFFSNDCADGVLPFDMDDWETEVPGSFMWAEPPAYSHMSLDRWRCTVKLVKLPGSETVTPSVTYVGSLSASSLTDLASKDFPDAALGSEDDGDLVLVITTENSGANTQISSVTVDDKIFTELKEATAGVGPSNGIAIYAGEQEESTGDIEINFVDSTFNGDVSVSIYRVRQNGSIRSPSDSDSNTSTSASSLAMSALTVPNPGVAVAGMAHATESVTVTWTGATERDDAATTNMRKSSATTVTAGTNTITATATGSGRMAVAAVAWS